MKMLVIPEKSVHTGSLILVNGQHPCCLENIESSLIPVHSGSSVLLERRAAVLLSGLMGNFPTFPLKGKLTVSPDNILNCRVNVSEEKGHATYLR